jgi:hypothetical protein
MIIVINALFRPTVDTDKILLTSVARCFTTVGVRFLDTFVYRQLLQVFIVKGIISYGVSDSLNRRVLLAIDPATLLG